MLGRPSGRPIGTVMVSCGDDCGLWYSSWQDAKYSGDTRPSLSGANLSASISSSIYNFCFLFGFLSLDEFFAKLFLLDFKKELLLEFPVLLYLL